MASFASALTRILTQAAGAALRAQQRASSSARGARGRGASRPDRPGTEHGRRPRPSAGAASVATGTLHFDYVPKNDGRPDPGEIVWAWVPFEEDDGRGKDRPVLIVSRDGADLLGLMLTSKDHDRDAADEARHGRHWVDIGAGAWDRQGRPSEVRVDRVLRLVASDVRREGAALDRARFDTVAAEAARVHG